MNKLKTIANKLKLNIVSAIKRYPLAVILFFLSAVSFMIVTEINSGSSNLDDEVFIRIAMSLIYAGFLSLTFNSVSERFNLDKIYTWLFNAASIAIGIIVFFFVIPEFDSAIPVIRFFLLLALTFALFFFVPFIRRDKSASYFAQKIFLRMAVTMIYYGIITGGVEAIIFAVENLLAVDIPYELYSHAAIIIAGLFIPSFFFAGIPKENDQEVEYPKLIKILLHYICYILLAAYSLVLYIYFIKILFSFTLPSNELGNLVIYYSLISIAVLYFGWYTKDENRWTNIFHKFYPYVLIIPTLMMIVSFWVRINQYGFTEPRYYAILVAIFVLRSISVIKLQKKVKLIPLVLAVLLLVSIYGPLSSFSVSKWSQNRRFVKILEEAKMLDGSIIPNENASDETKYAITEIVSYFKNSHNTADMKYIDSEFATSEMQDIFGFEATYAKPTAHERNYYYVDSYDESGVTDIKGYDYLTTIDSGKMETDYELTKESLQILTHVTQDGKHLLSIIADDIVVYEKDMGEWLIPLAKETTGEENTLYLIEDENSDIKIKIILEYANYYETDNDLYYSAKLLFTVK